MVGFWCCCQDDPLPPAFWGMSVRRINLPDKTDPDSNDYLNGTASPYLLIPNLDVVQYGYQNSQVTFRFGWQGYEWESPGGSGNYENDFTCDALVFSWVGGGDTVFEYGPDFVGDAAYPGVTYQDLRAYGTDYTVKVKFYMYNYKTGEDYNVSTFDFKYGTFWYNSTTTRPEHFRGKTISYSGYSQTAVPAGEVQLAKTNQPDPAWNSTSNVYCNSSSQPTSPFTDSGSTFSWDSSYDSVLDDGVSLTSSICYLVELDVTSLYRTAMQNSNSSSDVQVFNLYIQPDVLKPDFEDYFFGMDLPEFGIIGDSHDPDEDTGFGVPAPELVFTDT